MIVFVKLAAKYLVYKDYILDLIRRCFLLFVHIVMYLTCPFVTDHVSMLYFLSFNDSICISVFVCIDHQGTE